MLVLHTFRVNPLSANPQNGQTHLNKTNFLSVFHHFAGLALNRLIELTRFSRFFGLIHASSVLTMRVFSFTRVSIRISEIWQIGTISKFLLSMCLRSKEFKVHAQVKQMGCSQV